jgi:hypothetical protein
MVALQRMTTTNGGLADNNYDQWHSSRKQPMAFFQGFKAMAPILKE